MVGGDAWGGMLMHLDSIASTLEPLFPSSTTRHDSQQHHDGQDDRALLHDHPLGVLDTDGAGMWAAKFSNGRSPLMPPAPSSDLLLHDEKGGNGSFHGSPPYSRSINLGEAARLIPKRPDRSFSARRGVSWRSRDTAADQKFVCFRKNLSSAPSRPRTGSVTRAPAYRSSRVEVGSRTSPPHSCLPSHNTTTSAEATSPLVNRNMNLLHAAAGSSSSHPSASYGSDHTKTDLDVDWNTLNETLWKNGLPTLAFITEPGQSCTSFLASGLR